MKLIVLRHSTTIVSELECTCERALVIFAKYLRGSDQSQSLNFRTEHLSTPLCISTLIGRHKQLINEILARNVLRKEQTAPSERMSRMGDFHALEMKSRLG